MEKLVISLKDKVIVYPTLNPLNIEPSITDQHYEPEEGYAYKEVNVSKVTNEIDENIKAENIKKDVTILGITGTMEGEIIPEVENETLIFSKNASVNEGVLDL